MHKSYTARLKAEFETLHPDIDLQLFIGMQHSTSDINYLTRVFTNNLIDGVEIDAINLSFLTEKGWAVPVTEKYQKSDENFYPQALEAFTVNDHIYAHPTALCTCFLFSRDKKITQAQNIQELLQILGRNDPSVPKILGNFLGVTVVPIFYGLFYAGVHGQNKLSSAMKLPLDQKVVRVMKETISDSIEYIFKKDPKPLSEYANTNPYGNLLDYIQGKAHSYIGFSEDLHYILTHGGGTSGHFIPALFGEKRPVLFANGIATSAVKCTEQRVTDVEAFAKYFRSIKTTKWRTLAQDTTAYPRYLLSAHRDFYNDAEILANPHFQKFKEVIENGIIFPNTGYVENREKITQEVYKQLSR